MPVGKRGSRSLRQSPSKARRSRSKTRRARPPRNYRYRSHSKCMNVPHLLLTFYHYPGTKTLMTELMLEKNVDNPVNDLGSFLKRTVTGVSDEVDEEENNIYYYLENRFVDDVQQEMSNIEEHLTHALSVTEVFRWNKSRFARNETKGSERNYTEYNVLFTYDTSSFTTQSSKLPDPSKGKQRFESRRGGPGHP